MTEVIKDAAEADKLNYCNQNSSQLMNQQMMMMMSMMVKNMNNQATSPQVPYFPPGYHVNGNHYGYSMNSPAQSFPPPGHPMVNPGYSVNHYPSPSFIPFGFTTPPTNMSAAYGIPPNFSGTMSSTQSEIPDNSMARPDITNFMLLQQDFVLHHLIH